LGPSVPASLVAYFGLAPGRRGGGAAVAAMARLCGGSGACGNGATAPVQGAMVVTATAVVMLIAAAAGQPAGERPICQLADALVGSVGAHLTEWDNQIEIGLNSTMNCSMFLEFVYLSRDRIRMQLEYVRGNFSAEDELFRARGEEGGSTTWAMTHMSTAASLVSAHLHIHGVLAAARPLCLSENLQLLFLMSLRRLKTLLYTQLRHLWIIFQGTAELFRQGAGRWLTEVVELFEADLRTMETIMVSWQPPAEEEEEGASRDASAPAVASEGQAEQAPKGSSRPGPPLPAFSTREPDGVALSTIEILRRDTFEEWDSRKPLLRALLRHVLPRDGHVADVCAGSGQAAEFLNDTGLVTAYAFDPSSNIRLLSKGVVDHARFHAERVQLWRSFDMLLCMTAAAYYGGAGPETWAKVWQNIDSHATRGAVLSCGVGEVRQQALAAAQEHAPGLQLDEVLSERLAEAAGEKEGACVFWRSMAS